MPARDGIAMFIGSGAPQSFFKDKSTHDAILVSVNAKHKDQQKAAKALDNIHGYITRLKSYPSGTAERGKWQITDVSTAAAANYIGKEEGGQHLFGSIIQIKIFFGGNT